MILYINLQTLTSCYIVDDCCKTLISKPLFPAVFSFVQYNIYISFFKISSYFPVFSLGFQEGLLIYDSKDPYLPIVKKHN
jgi:hypothetical protein